MRVNHFVLCLCVCVFVYCSIPTLCCNAPSVQPSLIMHRFNQTSFTFIHAPNVRHASSSSWQYKFAFVSIFLCLCVSVFVCVYVVECFGTRTTKKRRVYFEYMEYIEHIIIKHRGMDEGRFDFF